MVPILSVMGGESHLFFVLVNTRTMEPLMGALLLINMNRIEKIAIRLPRITTLGTGEKLSRTDSQLPSRDHKLQKWTSHANNSPVDGTEVSWEDDRIDVQDASYFLRLTLQIIHVKILHSHKWWCCLHLLLTRNLIIFSSSIEKNIVLSPINYRLM